MQNITITKPNAKGQVVIPKVFRDDLGIMPGTPLQITKQGDGLVVLPLQDWLPKFVINDKTYRLWVLKEMQGTWGPETAAEKKWRLKSEKVEKAAIKRMRKAW